ncbi:hypothetical protein HHL22_21205 [Hymenobacter sp. RP-2-7]|uniref:Uncharacterized protein n=1 Tax=Hymenobacter polaris TaxID=2682546 RepID=A0A7Y0AID1_9BACT|nr:hypothetical protein [Hymenobacter polaris]NML67727.1 hypothetical protein [Hymenobacter polaris]
MRQFLTILLVLGALGARAQRHPAPPPPPDAPQQLARAELLLDPDLDEVQVQALPADTSVVLFIRHQAPGQRQVRYAFQRYGLQLRLRDEEAVEIPAEFELRRMCSEPGVVYALFSALDGKGRLLAAAYDVRGGQVRVQAFDTKLTRQVGALKALNGRLLANVSLSDDQHQTVLLLDVASGKFQFLPTVYEPLNSELTSVADRPGRRAEFVLSQSNGRKQRLMLKRLSAEQGELLNSEMVQTESERSLLTAQLSPPADTTTRLLAGTYALRDVQYAQGLFATDLTKSANAASKSALRFYDFRRLRHFFDYLNPAHEARLRDRAARREARAAAPIRWRYHLLLHELLPQPGGGYTLVAEVYTPQYTYPSNGYGNGMFTPLATTYAGGPRTLGMPGGYYGGGRVLLGFRTSHVLVCGFDKRGGLLWDNTYVVTSDVVRSELEEAVQPLTLADGRVVLAYLNTENELHYKCINQGEAGANDRQVPLLTYSTDGKTPDKVLHTSQPELMPWAENQFVASGFQRVRSGQGPERQVFFLQALRF